MHRSRIETSVSGSIRTATTPLWLPQMISRLEWESTIELMGCGPIDIDHIGRLGNATSHMRMAPTVSPATTQHECDAAFWGGFRVDDAAEEIDDFLDTNTSELYPRDVWLELLSTRVGLVGNLRRSNSQISLRFEKEHAISSCTTSDTSQHVDTDDQDVAPSAKRPSTVLASFIGFHRMHWTSNGVKIVWICTTARQLLLSCVHTTSSNLRTGCICSSASDISTSPGGWSCLACIPRCWSVSLMSVPPPQRQDQQSQRLTWPALMLRCAYSSKS